MRLTLIVALIVGSFAGYAAAQVRQGGESRTAYAIKSEGGSTVWLRADRMENQQTAVYGQNVTLTIGDVVIAADDATVLRGGEVRLGANARLNIPVPVQ